MKTIERIKTFFEDKYLMVIDKPANLLVHPTQAPKGPLPEGDPFGVRGRKKDTLVDYIRKCIPEIEKLKWPDKTRPGIVHRLDKDTSGLIIIAKTPEVLQKLQKQFKNRKVQKTYTVLVLNKLSPPQGKIEAPITRDQAGTQKVQELNYSFSKKTTRPAVTFYKVLRYYRYNNNDLTLLEAHPKTGRMHQIRVHLKHIGHPIIGDPLYNTKASRKTSKELGIGRQFLHATELEFTHPITSKKMKFKSDLPNNLKNIMVKL